VRALSMRVYLADGRAGELTLTHPSDRAPLGAS
jgi:hypothetical protein